MASTSGPQQANSFLTINLGVAAHITAASSGGPRFDASLTPEQRRSADNGIWLCQICAKLIDDDVEAYPTLLLKEWKANAEQTALLMAGKPIAFAGGKRADITFVDSTLTISQNKNIPTRLRFGLHNRGELDAVVAIRDHTYTFTVDLERSIFPYLPVAAEEMLIKAIPNAVSYGEIRYDFPRINEWLHELNSGRARLFFYARGEYRDTAGHVFSLPYAGMYDPFIPGNLIAPPRGVVFE